MMNKRHPPIHFRKAAGMFALFAGCSSLAAADTASTKGFVWPSAVPADCPFPRSPTLTGVYFTGKHSDYLMCVTDGWPTVAKMNSYILEADQITGPWRMVTYLKDFGEQAYFLNFPSKFISPDGKSLWLCYSANFSSGWNGLDLKYHPPGGSYGLCLHELKLLGPIDDKPK